ncbi:MAG TPA: HEAT repeat domain-containing protein [Acidobacteriota bacterium]|jgi:HEAT repeat protein|nr:HEAT repeat domain-containing protein [Acidobacteriota bacterium]
MQTCRGYSSALRLAGVILGAVLSTVPVDFSTAIAGQGQASEQRLTPRQLEIERQRQRLSSGETEDRREAVTRLGAMRHPAASRAALSALSDPSPMVRATAAAAILSLPPEESAGSLLPLLADKDEFVRQQVTYALGHTRSRSAVPGLTERLADKKDSVRASAAVALGQIADAAAVPALAAVLNPQSGFVAAKKNKKSRTERNPFVLRAAARSLGQIGDRAGLPALILVLQDKKAEDDVRREAASALGAIGDPAAIPALREVLTARDPYLAQTAHEAIRKISRLQNSRGN